MVTAGPMEQNIVPRGMGWVEGVAEVKVFCKSPFEGPEFGAQGSGHENGLTMCGSLLMSWRSRDRMWSLLPTYMRS